MLVARQKIKSETVSARCIWGLVAKLKDTRMFGCKFEYPKSCR
jgi:hypothetical protein